MPIIDEGDPFFGPFLKIKRADNHISDFQDQTAAFIAREPYAVVAEDLGDGKLSWTIRIKENVPYDFATIVGDCIHNLRDALDLAIAAIARASGKDDRNVYFPTADNRDALISSLNCKIRKWASAQIIEAIESQIEPYLGGHSAILRSLHHLSIIDKHRLIVPVVSHIELLYIIAKRASGPNSIPFMKPYSG